MTSGLGTRLAHSCTKHRPRLLPSGVKPHPMKTIYTTVTLVASQRQKCCTDDIKNSSSINAAINVTSHSPKSGYTGDFTHTNHAVGVNQIPDYWDTIFSQHLPPPPSAPPQIQSPSTANRGGMGQTLLAHYHSAWTNQSMKHNWVAIPKLLSRQDHLQVTGWGKTLLAINQRSTATWVTQCNRITSRLHTYWI